MQNVDYFLSAFSRTSAIISVSDTEELPAEKYLRHMRDPQLKREDSRGTGEDRQLKRIQEIKNTGPSALKYIEGTTRDLQQKTRYNRGPQQQRTATEDELQGYIAIRQRAISRRGYWWYN